MNDPEPGLAFAVEAGDDAGSPSLTVRGEIDVATAPQLRVALSRALDAGARRITVDVRDVPFIDSSGLGVLVGALRRLRESGGTELIVVGLQDPVRKVFDITGLDQLFTLVT
jgi:anti-sigma B factor antagonist